MIKWVLLANKRANADAEQVQPVAWAVHPFDYGIGHDGVHAVTQRPEQVEMWKRKGWAVRPLVFADTAPPRQPEQAQPVAYVDQHGVLYHAEDAVCVDKAKMLTPIYTTPPRQPEQLTNDRVDAERYRWLRNADTDVSLVIDKRTRWVPPDETVPGVGGYWMYEYRCGQELDEAIDRAIEAKHGIKENT